MLLMAWAMLQAAQTFTLQQARALSPAALADALLGVEHAPIGKTIVHPVGMDPPSKSLQLVTFLGIPGVAPDEPGWCRRIDRFVHLAPLAADANAYRDAVPTRVEEVESRQLYRLAAGVCGDAGATFFAIRADSRDAQFALIATLRAARRAARGAAALPFTLRCVDEDGARSPDSGGNRCRDGAGRALLASLPLDGIYNVSAAGTGIAYRGNQPPKPHRYDASIGMSDGVMAIDVEVAEAGGRITSIALKRHLPYPF